MEIRTLGSVTVSEQSQVSEARRFAGALARSLHFEEADSAKLAIVVTELATNLVKHGRGGDLVFNQLNKGELHGLGVIALDKGPGIQDVTASLRDGFSTSGSAGTGLGAVMRMASRFDIYSTPQAGTALMARIWPHRAVDEAIGPFDLGSVSLPRHDEEACGDAWCAEQVWNRARFFIADGLGHGVDAAEAAERAVRIVRGNTGAPESVLAAVHEALRQTRGAAVALADVDPRRRVVRFVGVGNISGVIVAPDRDYNMVSHPGTMGHEVHKIHEYTYPVPDGAILIMHSDGLSRRWRLQDYPGLAARSPAVIAGVLYRDFRRENDDATILVAREVADGEGGGA